MALSGLDNTNLKLILVGGKGGVGKTSCATSIGLELSKTHKTLIISTDPAHSISDCVSQKMGNGIHFIDGVENLAVTEILAEQVYDNFKEKHEEELKGLFETSTKLDSEDIDDLLRLSIPGIDEVMSLMTIIDIIEEGKFDKYVVDTAPTGHALRMISSPKVLDQWIKVAARMRWKYRYMVTSFSGTYTQDKTDALLLNLKKTVKKIERLFRDVTQCEFIPVCIPESMAVMETNRLISSLHNSNLSVRQIIVNNVLQSESCSFCKERQVGQQKYIEQIGTTYPKLNRVIMPLFASEIKGLEKLNQMRMLLFK
ncbi:MAG: arsenite-transporting ATPase [Algoriphagus sp.]|jgi:arsenite-transporting ATPase